MTDEAQAPGEANLFPKTVGERLREARLAQRLELADIAQRTRVPQRHLQSIEDGNFGAIPTPTYAVGFARAYARAVGVDEVEIAREVRGQSEVAVAERRPTYQPYDIQEAQRAPSSGVMVGAGLLALVLAIAALVWFGTDWLRGGQSDAAPVAATTDAAGAATPAPAATAPANGQVTLVATDEVWVRVYDAAGKTLKTGTMRAGERYDVPPDTNGPLINIGRPDKLQVLVGGVEVAPLGSGKVAIKDVPISAAALTGRNLPAPTPTTSPGASPAASPTVPTPPTALPTAGAAQPATNSSPSVPPFFRDPAGQPAPAPTTAAGNSF